MFANPMDTTIHSGKSRDDQIEILKRHVLDTLSGHGSQLIPIQEHVHDDFTIYALGTGPIIDPKPFIHPVQFTVDEQTYMIADMRSSTRWDRTHDQSVESNPGLFRRDVILTVMQATWEGEGPGSIQRLGNFQISIFADWMANSIIRRFGLDAGQQLKLKSIAAFYYLCLFSDERRFDPMRAAPLVARAVSANTAYVMELVETLPYIKDIVEFLEVVQDSLATERLSGLRLDFFMASLSGSWFGPNNNILVAVATEYPPTFVSLLYLALTDRGTRNTGISQVALKKERDIGAKEFIRITSDLLKTETA